MNPMTNMTQLAAQIAAEGAVYDHAADLPFPNIYWATVSTFDGQAVNTFIAADHTNAAVGKVSNWCAANHKFRPHRSNSVIKLRRMLLGDVIHNPAAFDTVFAAAIANNEHDNIAKLRMLPLWIADKVKVTPDRIDMSSADAIWQRVASDLERYSAPVRVLR